MACPGPSIRITNPKDGDTLVGVSSYTVTFEVDCSEFPGAVFARLWEITTHASGMYVDMHVQKVGLFQQVMEGKHVRVSSQKTSFTNLDTHPPQARTSSK